MVASKKSKRITMQRIVVREDFVKYAMETPNYTPWLCQEES